MEPYVRVNASTRDAQELDNNVSRVFNSISKNPLLRSPSFIQNLVFTGTTDLVISHRLNRPVVGYIITMSNSSQTIYKSSTTNISPSTRIILKATGTTTVDILFF